MSIVSLKIMADIMGYTEDNFFAQIHKYKRRHGRYPDWYIYSSRKEGKAQIDMKKYLHYIGLGKRLQSYCTDKLYWIFMAVGFTDSDLADLMSKKSKYFTSRGSWISFFAKALFSRSSQNIAIEKPTMMTEFARIGIKYLALAKRWNKLDYSKQYEYYED